MDPNISPSNLNNKNVDFDSDFQPQSKKVKLNNEARCSQVKSEAVLLCNESGVLPSSPPSLGWNILKITETIPLIKTFNLNDIISWNPVLCEAK